MTYIIPKKCTTNNKFLKNFRKAQLEAEKNKKELIKKITIIRLQELTNMDELLCKSILESCDWNINIALEMYYS